MREMAEAMKRQADAADCMLQHIQGDRDDRPQERRAIDGHYARDCPQNKQTSEGAKRPTKGRVFTLKGEEAIKSDDLIEGTGIDVILGMNWAEENPVIPTQIMREMAEAMKRQADAADRMLQNIQGDRDDRP
ncbi:Gag-Pol polyprotein [Senna tora]|uniref:Gag-Pol polyprotein n=1 Tax=Senna tora TaxID=362788 RepID=A0A834X7D2_9FABA|nr:Gag-Pol polyprotein [Senna tora]